MSVADVTFTTWFSLAQFDQWLCTFTRKRLGTNTEKATLSTEVGSWIIVTLKEFNCPAFATVLITILEGVPFHSSSSL